MTPAALYAGGGAVLAALPLAMALANRSSPALVGIASALFLAGRIIEDRAQAVRLLRAPLRTPPAAAAAAFVIWCAASLAWSPFPSTSLRAAGEFLPTLAAAYVLAALAPGRLPDRAAPLAAAATALAAAYVVTGLALGLPVQRLAGARVADFVFNRSALTLILVCGPVALVLWRSGRPGLAAATILLGGAAVLRSVSGAAALGAASGLAMFALARLLPARAAAGLAGAGLALAVALAPVEGDVLERVLPEAVHERLHHSSSRGRVVIARSFGAAVAAEPWRGAGYGVSPRFAEAPVAGRLEPDLRVMLGAGHPHNAFLQVWAELGVVGAALAALLLLLAVREAARLPGARRATALGLIAAASAIAFVEHNVWAAWWTAGLGAAITWLRAAAQGDRERRPRVTGGGRAARRTA